MLVITDSCGGSYGLALGWSSLQSRCKLGVIDLRQASQCCLIGCCLAWAMNKSSWNDECAESHCLAELALIRTYHRCLV